MKELVKVELTLHVPISACNTKSKRNNIIIKYYVKFSNRVTLFTSFGEDDIHDNQCIIHNKYNCF